MAERGWKQLLANHTWFHGKGKYPISADSEFITPPLYKNASFPFMPPVVPVT
jgi:hypothetical protein